LSDILENISSQFDELTHSQKKIANYILENTNTLAFSTLDESSSRIGVSTTSIIRFARMLGYSGYSDMQRDIQQSIKDKFKQIGHLEKSHLTHDSKLLSHTFQQGVSNIDATLSLLKKEDIDTAIDLIRKANRVYCLGMRSSFALSYYMAMCFSRLHKHIRLIQAIAMSLPEEIISASSSDVCVAFMFPRYSRQTAHILTYFKKINVPVILITGPSWVDIKKYGTVVLPCQVNGIMSRDSYAAPVCLIDYLTAVFENETDSDPKGDRVLEDLESLLDEGFYLGL